jgi:dTMP kinase
MTSKTPITSKLIAVEGLDGSGKSTQIRLLHQWLEGLDVKVFFTEWNSSELIRGATKRGKKEEMLTPTTFSLIHAADFADRYERQILPMLRAGYIVLCDRYMYTAFARDFVRGCDPAWVSKMYAFARPPDLTLYFRVPLQTALRRILSGRPELKFYEAGMDLNLAPTREESFKKFQALVLDRYEALAAQHKFTVFDGRKGIHELQEQVRATVQNEIDLARFHRKGGLHAEAVV